MSEGQHTHARRQPEQAEVYDLGHYEAMIVGKALAFAAGRDESYSLSADEARDLWRLATVFQHGGTITVIRRVDQ